MTPTTIEDVESLIANKVQEDVHLDYKQSAAISNSKRIEIGKDVSAFANSDGGLLIYGVVEEDNLPVRTDEGVEDAKFSREWLEQVINTNISPRIEGVRIFPIAVSGTNSVYVIEIPKSYRAPHQASDKRYYKRYNFQSAPMEDYEINDIRNRQSVASPLINIHVESKSHMAYIIIENVGSISATDVTFSISQDVKWRRERTPALFENGIEFFPSNQSFRLIWNTFPDLFSLGDPNYLKINISVRYFHSQINQYIQDEFHLDIEGYRDNAVTKSDVQELSDVVKELLKGVIREITSLSHRMENIASIAGASGLNLSITTLRNLKHIASESEHYFQKLNPQNCDCRVFMEVLEINFDLADRIEMHFTNSESSEGLEDIAGVTPELIQKIKEYFLVDK